MEVLPIHADGTGAWDDVNPAAVVEPDKIEMAALASGTDGGNPSVAIRFDLPDGRTAIGHTTLRLFLSAADVFKARHGDPR